MGIDISFYVTNTPEFVYLTHLYKEVLKDKIRKERMSQLDEIRYGSKNPDFTKQEIITRQLPPQLEEEYNILMAEEQDYRRYNVPGEERVEIGYSRGDRDFLDIIDNVMITQPNKQIHKQIKAIDSLILFRFYLTPFTLNDLLTNTVNLMSEKARLTKIYNQCNNANLSVFDYYEARSRDTLNMIAKTAAIMQDYPEKFVYVDISY